VVNHQIIRNVRGAAGEKRQARATRNAVNCLLPTAYCLLLALALGAVMAVASSSPEGGVVLLCLGVCGVLGLAAWLSVRLPLVSILRLALIASFSFRLEKNFFPIWKHHENPPGIMISLMLILSVMLAVAYLFRRWQGDGSGPVFPKSFSVTLGLLFLWCSLSVVYGGEKWLGGYALFGLASSYLMCFMVAAHFSDRRALRAAVVLIAVVVGLSSGLGLLQQWFGGLNNWALAGGAREDFRQTIAEGEVSRVTGLLEVANAFGWFLATFTPVIIAMLLMRVGGFHRRVRILLWVSSSLGVVALILTYARGSWMAFGCSMILLSCFAYRALPPEGRGRFSLKLTGLLVLLSLICLPYAGSIYTRLTEDDRGSASVRVPLMQVAFEMIKDNPLLGVGLSSYETEMRRYDHTPENITDDFDYPVHNMFLHMTVEAGIPGLLCFFALLAIAFWQGKQAWQGRDPFLRALALGLISGLVAFLGASLKDPGSFGGGEMSPCLLFCGLLIATGRASQLSRDLSGCG